MTPLINDDAILVLSKYCVLRPQKEHLVFYNRKSDELHVTGPDAKLIVDLLDGLRTVKEVESALFGAESPSDHEPSTAPSRVRTFLGELQQRGLIEVRHE